MVKRGNGHASWAGAFRGLHPLNAPFNLKEKWAGTLGRIWTGKGVCFTFGQAQVSLVFLLKTHRFECV